MISGFRPVSNFTKFDSIVAVVAGDWVTGREPYKQPMKVRPCFLEDSLPEFDFSTVPGTLEPLPSRSIS